MLSRRWKIYIHVKDRGLGKSIGSAFDQGTTRGFDYLRLLLAAGVLIFHSHHLSMGFPTNTSTIAAAVERIIVPMFFGLSGFLVSASLEHHADIRGYLIARVLRVGPALTVSVVASALILGPLVSTSDLRSYFNDPAALRYLVNIVGWSRMTLPGVFNANPIPAIVNGSLWTIPWELVCYLLLPAIALAAGRTRRSVVPVAFAVLAIFQIFYPPDLSLGGVTATGPTLIATFLAGASIHTLRCHVPRSLPLAIILGLACPALLATEGLRGFAPAVIAYTAVALGCTAPPASVLVDRRDYSFGIYVYAFPIQQVMVQNLSEGRPLMTLVLSAPLVLMVAALSWHLIEGPALRLKPKTWHTKQMRRVGARP